MGDGDVVTVEQTAGNFQASLLPCVFFSKHPLSASRGKLCGR